MPNKLTAEEQAAKEIRAAAARARFARAQKEARQAEEARLAEQQRLRDEERARIVGLCEEAADTLSKDGWQEVNVDHRAFFTIRGKDSVGRNHSLAGDDLDTLVLEAMEAGKPPAARKPAPEPVAAPPPVVEAAPAPPSVAIVVEAPPPENPDALLDDRAFPLMSQGLRDRFKDGETFRTGHLRLTEEMRIEYDKMMQLLLSGASDRVVNKETGQKAGERQAELSRLKNELEEIGNRVGVTHA